MPDPHETTPHVDSSRSASGENPDATTDRVESRSPRQLTPGGTFPAEAASLLRELNLSPDPADTATDRGGASAGEAASMPAVPGYEILGELGRGGMGVVFKARQTAADRLVALKMILSGGFSGGTELARFRAEAAAVARLQHPHIVQLFEVGEHAGRPFFSLEFCPGGSLDRRLKGDPLPARAAAELVRQIARGVAAAHDAGVVHRDLKPANVLLAADGTPKVADFGLAKRLDDDAGHTRTDAVMGTPAYMAPEQAAGGTKTVGPPADVYALGVVLYELLTGRPPFKGTSVLDTLEQVRTLDPVAPRALIPTVPRDLETVCLKCLHKQPGRRYPTAGELADDLGRFLEGRPVVARPVGVAERGWKWCRRNPAVAASLVAFSLAVAGVIATLLVSDQKVRAALGRETAANTNLTLANEELGDERTNLVRTLGERDRANTALGKAVADEKAAARAARHQAYNLGTFVAGREFLARDLRAMRSELDRAPAEFRNWEWNYLRRQAGAGVVRFVPFAADERPEQVAFSPDGTLLVTAGMKFHRTGGRSGFLRVYDVRTGNVARSWEPAADELARVGPQLNLFCEIADPEVKRVLVTVSKAAAWQLRDAGTGRVIAELPNTPRTQLRAVHTPDGSKLAYLDAAKGLVVLDQASGKALHRMPAPDELLMPRLVADPHSPLAAVVTAQDVNVIDLGAGRQVARMQQERLADWRSGAGVAFGADAKLFIPGGQLHEHDARSGVLLRSLPTGPAERFVVAPAADRVAVWRTGQARVHNYRTGMPLYDLAGPRDESGASRGLRADPAVSRSGVVALPREDGVFLLDATRDPTCDGVPLPAGEAAASPDGRYVSVHPGAFAQPAPGGVPTEVQFFDAATGGALGAAAVISVAPKGGVASFATRVWPLPGGLFVVSEPTDPGRSVRVRAFRIGGEKPEPLGEREFLGTAGVQVDILGGGAGRVLIKLQSVDAPPVRRTRVLLWEPGANAEPAVLHDAAAPNGVWAENAQAAAVSADGGTVSLCVAARDVLPNGAPKPLTERHSLIVFDAAGGTPRRAIPIGSGRQVIGLVLQPGAPRAFVHVRDGDGAERVSSWNTATGEPEAAHWKGSIPLPTAFDAAGRVFAGATADGFGVWDAATGERRWNLTGEHYHPAFSPDGTRLAALAPRNGLGAARQLVVFDAGTGKELLAVTAPPVVGRLWFDPAGRLHSIGTVTAGRPERPFEWPTGVLTWDGSPLPDRER